MENVGKRPEHTRDVGILLQRKIQSKAVSRRMPRKKGKQEYKASREYLEQEASREYLEQVKCCNDTDCTPRMMKRAFLALKEGSWEEYKNIFRTEVKATEWAFDRIKEAFEKVAKNEARKLSTVQEIMIRSTDHLRRIIAPAVSKEALRCHTCARTATVSRWKTTFGGSQGKKQTNWWCAMCGDWRAPYRVLVVQYLRAFAQIFLIH